MPITGNRRESADHAETEATETEAQTFTRFVYRPNWFVLAQTDGQDVEPEPIPVWDRARALDALGIV